MDGFEGLSARLSEVATLLLPEGAAVTSGYGSWDYDENAGKLLAVAPPSLISLEVRFQGSGRTGRKRLR